MHNPYIIIMHHNLQQDYNTAQISHDMGWWISTKPNYITTFFIAIVFTYLDIGCKEYNIPVPERRK